jgi:hypothetical protein
MGCGGLVGGHVTRAVLHTCGCRGRQLQGVRSAAGPRRRQHQLSSQVITGSTAGSSGDADGCMKAMPGICGMAASSQPAFTAARVQRPWTPCPSLTSWCRLRVNTENQSSMPRFMPWPQLMLPPTMPILMGLPWSMSCTTRLSLQPEPVPHWSAPCVSGGKHQPTICTGGQRTCCGEH